MSRKGVARAWCRRWAIALGCIVHTLACAFGLAASVTAFTIVKFAGAIYLIYLGVQLIFAKPAAAKTSDKPSEATRVRAAPKSLQQIFTQGFVTNVLNPKVVLFFVSFIPQFVAVDSAHKTLAFLALGFVFGLVSTFWNTFVAWIAGSVTQRFSGKPSVKLWLDKVVGSAFVRRTGHQAGDFTQVIEFFRDVFI